MKKLIVNIWECLKRNPVRFFFNTFFPIILIALIFLWGGLNYAGYCLDQNKFLSDEEKIRIAVGFVQSHSSVVIERHEGNQNIAESFKAVPYKNFSDFMDKNPNCCAFKDDPHRPRPDGILPASINWGKFLGRSAANVFVNYKAQYVDKNGAIKSTPQYRRVNIQNCGRVRF